MSSSREPRGLPRAGDIIAGKYAIVRVLGEGGMGVVFEATHVRLRQRVAIKMLLPEMLEHDVIVTRFEREARAAAQLRSRHVARVMDVDTTPEGVPYMVMEFLEGHDLQAELDRRQRLPYEEVVDYVLQACAAMAEAHQLGIVHRDLKPSNLFLADDGGARLVKVLDFGISKVQSEADAKLTGSEAVMGTAFYMSPEQVRSSSNVDGRTDIWALGVILYELLSGQPPWTGTPTQVAAQIVSDDPPDLTQRVALPRELVAIVLRALQRRPEDRFVDVRALASALGPFVLPNTAGRLALDTLFAGSAPSLPRVSVAGPRDDASAATMPHPAAVSQPDRSATNEGGTAPGWSQHEGAPSRGRTALVGLVLAFVIGLVVIGGVAFAVMRARSPRPDPTAAAPLAPPSTLTAPAQPVTPVTGAGSAAPVAAASASARPAASVAPVPPRAPATAARPKPATPGSGPAAAKPEAPKPPPTSNPLTL
jgi:serine/threonine-protein kinase